MEYKTGLILEGGAMRGLFTCGVIDVLMENGIRFDGGNFGLDWEIVIRFVRKGYRAVEIPITYNARSYEEGKHIALFATPIEGLRALYRSRFKADVYDYGDE